MSTEPRSTNQCTHLNAAGRRCRLTVAPTHDALCAHHLQQHLASQPDPEAVAAELLDSTGNLNTADRVNTLLANTVKQLARQRIDRRDALAIGYLAQLLLNTVPGVQKEYQAIRASEARQALRKSVAESLARLRPPAAQVATEPATEQETAAPQKLFAPSQPPPAAALEKLSAPPPEPPPQVQVPEEDLLVAAGADVHSGDAHT